MISGCTLPLGSIVDKTAQITVKALLNITWFTRSFGKCYQPILAAHYPTPYISCFSHNALLRIPEYKSSPLLPMPWHIYSLFVGMFSFCLMMGSYISPTESKQRLGDHWLYLVTCMWKDICVVVLFCCLNYTTESGGDCGLSLFLQGLTQYLTCS